MTKVVAAGDPKLDINLRTEFLAPLMVIAPESAGPGSMTNSVLFSGGVVD